MIIWVLGVEGSHLRYIIHYDVWENGKITQNQQAKLFKLDTINKTASTDKGDFDIIENYKNFKELGE